MEVWALEAYEMCIRDRFSTNTNFISDYMYTKSKINFNINIGIYNFVNIHILC